MIEMHDLQGAGAIVTGAAQGLGLAIVRDYARAGMRLAIMDVQAERLHTAADEARALGATACVTIPVDLADAAATQQAAQAALDAIGTPRVLVHNAALLVQRSMLEITYADWRREVDIILQAAFILSKAVWPGMIAAGGGSIIYISSGSGIRGFYKEVAYCPAKHGQEGLMKVLAMEGAEYGIAVNTVTPGAPIHTPMSEANYTEADRQRWIDPAIIAPAFVHLARQTPATLTGQRVSAYEIAQGMAAGG